MANGDFDFKAFAFGDAGDPSAGGGADQFGDRDEYPDGEPFDVISEGPGLDKYSREADEVAKANTEELCVERAKLLRNPDFLSSSWKGQHPTEHAAMCNRLAELNRAIVTPRDRLDPLARGMVDSAIKQRDAQVELRGHAEKVMDHLEGLGFQREKIPADIRDFEIAGLAAQGMLAEGRFSELVPLIRLGINKCPQTQTADIEALYAQFQTEEDDEQKTLLGERLIFQIVSRLQKMYLLRRNCIREDPEKSKKGGKK